ncbi:hypothetical protein [Methylocystis echinoides]|jgi:hypothetical protein|uniref:hypothetical protein n=1 Tax=Methylocystis echinoides TaxID=29468 RepID=UPI00343ECB44
MLFYIGLFLSVIFAIDVFAEMFGYGPQAYIGAPFGVAAFLLLWRFRSPQTTVASEPEEARDEPEAAPQASTPQRVPPEILEKWARRHRQSLSRSAASSASASVQSLSSATPDQDVEKKHRRRRGSQKRPEPPSILERLKKVARSLDS